MTSRPFGALTVDLQGAVAVVSGGSSGIGAAISRRLASAGAVVVVGGRDAARSDAVVSAIVEAGGRAVAVLGDVADPDTSNIMIATATDTFGPVDIVVNAAGVIHRGDATETSDDDWRHIMSINVDGTFFLSRAAIAAMRSSGAGSTGSRGGTIVNVSSTCGLVGAAGLAAYCASKGAVTNLTRAMALDHAAEGIRINAICPGAVDTPMLAFGADGPDEVAAVYEENLGLIPEGRIPSADEVADLVLFLCSDGARHINGANLSVDGGYTSQ